MRKIEGELNTPFQRDVPFIEGSLMERTMKISTKKEWAKFGATVNRVRSSEGFPVKSFRDLIDQVALVTINNRNYEMFYRGQSNDYLNNQGVFYQDRKKKSTIFPSICRPEMKVDGIPKYSVRKKTIEDRYDKLYSFIDFINKIEKKKYRDEYLMSLFQHYEILPTPLIDITQSLRVAATFALMKKQEGYVYVFGLPFPNQSISYFTDYEIILLKLQNIVNINALRPRYQEGYLVGKFPFSNTKSVGDDLSNRMIAKFYVNNKDNQFWDDYFLPMPKEVLFPPADNIETLYKEYLKKFEKKIL